MSDFSIGDAVGSGFGLISKRPLSVLAWAVVYLALAMAPALAHFEAVQPAWSGMMRSILDGWASGHPPDLESLQSYSQQMRGDGFVWLAMLGGALATAILTAAIFRSVLEPRNTSFASLRFGAQELWLLLLGVVLYILFVAICVAAGILAGILIAVAAVAGHGVGGNGGGWIAGILVGVCAMALVAWIFLRWSLAAPLTFADKQFRLFESWNLTKGRAWKLLGLTVVMILIVIGLEIAIAIVTGVIGFAAVGARGGFNPSSVGAIVSGLNLNNPVFLLLQAFSAIVRTGVLVIWLAPWAVVYRELSGRTTHPDVF
jgi:hypothetical protein